MSSTSTRKMERVRVLDWEQPGLGGKERRRRRRSVMRQAVALVKSWSAENTGDAATGLARRTFPRSGEARVRNLRRSATLSRPEFREASTFTLSGAFPWVSQSGLGTVKAFIGHITEGGGMWCLDPWEAYEKGLITGFACVLIGTVGTGKSTTVKVWVTRLVRGGRKAVIMSDPKAEWVIVARALVSDPEKDPEITIGVEGHVINPLDPGRRPSTDESGEPMTDEAWVRAVAARRASVMKTIVRILSGRAMTGAEKVALNRALGAASQKSPEDLAAMTPQTVMREAAAAAPTIPDVIAALYDPDEDTEAKTGEAGREVANHLTELVEGELGGLFDSVSTVTMDESLPMTVFNTRPLKSLPKEARQIASLCVASWAESVVTNRDNGQWITVYEEGWENMDDENALERMVSQWKLARAYGLFSILILHKLRDLFRAGDAGSRARELAMSLLADTDIRVVHRQKPDQLAATADLLGLTQTEREEVGKAPKGAALWKVAELEGRVVKTHRSEVEAALFDTDQAMAETA